jgi:hypothetical protein
VSRQLANPMASLVSIPFQFNWYAPIAPFESTGFLLNLQPVADHDGNICRASPSSGWQHLSNGGWSSVDSSLRSSFDNQAFARGLRQQRWGDFRSGGWGGRFGDDGFADRFGGFGGFGGRFGGGFGGFRGRR